MSKSLRPIQEIVKKLEFPEKYFEQIGPYGGKVRLDLLKDSAFPRRGKLILVTATTPTASGEGKTVTSIGLTQGLARIGKKVIITSREPSLGPVFGMKGGAAGGGASTIETAHNLLAALIDAHLFHGNDLNLESERIFWPRCMDMNDRALRDIVVSAGSKKPGVERRTGFVITAASEIMAIVALAKDREDLRRRLDHILVGITRDGKPVYAKDFQATGAMMALLTEAIQPNLVQTIEGVPAFVHAGPFGNIAHGTSSIISQDMGLRLADYVVNECGFAADLGAEKYIDIVYRTTGVSPSAVVLVTTVQSLRNQGEGDLEKGIPNLVQHLHILRSFGLPTVVAINRFPNDTDADLERLERACRENGALSARHTAFMSGGAGTEELARRVVDIIEKNPGVRAKPVYDAEDGLEAKIQKVAREVYGASGVVLSDKAKTKLQDFANWGFGKVPVCIAKTQYSFTDDPKRMGAPKGWELKVTDASLSAGAGFVVVISGNMMLMPGLPKVSRAVEVDVDSAGEIVGI